MSDSHSEEKKDLDLPTPSLYRNDPNAIKVLDDIFGNDGSIDSVYHGKSLAINNAMAEVGMGRYQWGLFFVCGFGTPLYILLFSELQLMSA